MKKFIRQLSNNAIFRDFDENDWRELESLSLLKKKSFDKGEILFSMGENTNEIGIITEGSVVIENNDILGNSTILNKLETDDVFAETYAITGNIIDEQRRKKKEELEKAETELAQTRREIKTDKLKGVAVDATTKAVERIGALFHDPKPARYEKQIADLQGVIADKDKCIGQLQQEIKTMQAGHDKEVANLKQEAQQVIKALMRVDELCPYVKGLLKWENYCKDVGLDKERTKALFTMQPYRYTGELHSIRYNHTFRANDVILQFKPDKDGPSGFQFTINGKDCDEWFRQQRKEFYERIGIDIEQTEQRRGMKM